MKRTTIDGPCVPDGSMKLRRQIERLHARLRRAEATLGAVDEAVIGTDAQGRIDYLNMTAERMLGRSANELVGRDADEAFSFHSVETHARLANPVQRCLDHGRVIERVGRSLFGVAGRSPVIVRERALPVIHEGRLDGVVLILTDMSLQSGLSEQLSWRCRHDSLTGLLNRDAFERRLTREIGRTSGATEGRHSLIYLDLDRFRIINDTCGHCAGDHVLLEITRLLQQHTRSSDIPARLGGDEFAILLRDCYPSNALQVATELCRSIEECSVIWKNRVFRHTASLGVVGIEPGMNSQDVLSAADVACYSAKDAGRNAVSLYCAEETPSGYRDMQWAGRLRRACDEDRFRLFCQPIVPVSEFSEATPHFELLLRVEDPNGNIIPATDFLPAAERFNMMPTIDRWVLRHTLEHLARRREDTALRPYMVSVNLSGKSLSDQSFLDFAREQLQAADLAENALCFEITETAAIDNIAAVVRFMREMRQLGCAFSLDDFGSGLSSFAYLKELPVDYLKIDGRFVRDVHKDSVDLTMVGAIGHIGAAIGVKTVAERVESNETLCRLRSLGIDFAQGYYFARPMPVGNRERLARLADQAIPHMLTA